MTGAILDTTAFAVDALLLQGALVEGDLVITPEDLAARLRVPAEFRLGGEGVPCGFGAPLLDALVADARRQVPLNCAAIDLSAPRPGHAAALAARFVVRNGVSEVVSTLAGEATYVSAHVSFVAEADDRHEGLVHLVANAGDGAVPDSAFRQLADVGARSDVLLERGSQRDANDVASKSDTAGALARIERLAHAEVSMRVAAINESVARRHRRDHDRVVAYFASLLAETRAPKRRQDAAVMEAKVAHLLAEREAKLRELAARFTVRATLAPAAILIVRVPAVMVTLRVRRRKAEGQIVVRLPAGAQSLDELACDGCGQSTARPAVCDDRLHVLCEECVPNAQGRPACPACL